MKERLQMLLDREHLTPVRFAELVEVQRSSVSHVLSGRNKPSLDFIVKILAAFPHVNPDWLLRGLGEYKRSAEAKKTARLVNSSMADDLQKTLEMPPSTTTAPLREEEPAAYRSNVASIPIPPSSSPSQESPSKPKPPIEASHPALGETKEVAKVVIFYNDHTFELFYPGQ